MPTTIDINEVRTLANIARRATTLFEDGYTVQANSTLSGCYEVISPAGAFYLVCTDTVMGHGCSCPCFAARNTCKHLLAVDALLQEQALCEVYEARLLADDDRYPEF